MKCGKVEEKLGFCCFTYRYSTSYEIIYLIVLFKYLQDTKVKNKKT